MEFWENEIMKRIEQGTDMLRLKSLIEKKLNQGFYIPEKFRGKIWAKLVRNHCGITEDLFLHLMKESKDFDKVHPKVAKSINVDM